MLQRKEAQPPNFLVRTNAIKIRVHDLLDADDGFWKDCFALTETFLQPTD